jgi:hypothetical protein
VNGEIVGGKIKGEVRDQRSEVGTQFLGTGTDPATNASPMESLPRARMPWAGKSLF